MDKVKIRHLGKQTFNFNHGNERETFAPNEAREVSAPLAEMLLRETRLERKWTKEGKLKSEDLLPLFEAAINENADGDATENAGNSEGEQ